MATWIYRFTLKDDSTVRAHTINMPEDPDETQVFLRIQALRTELDSRGYQFLDARPMTSVELRLHTLQEKKKRRKKAQVQVSYQENRNSRFHVFLAIFLLLAALAILWHLYA